jgi:diacylglycerol kinase family enzyme
MAPVNGIPVHAQVDGEAIGALPATISIVPDAVTLLLPKRYAEG